MNLQNIPTKDLLEELVRRNKELEKLFTGKKSDYDNNQYSQFTETWEQR